jgi:cbb3-type cytochrome oxidase maturation protein
MSVLVILIIFSITVAILFLSLFIWAVKSGQYDDTDSPAIRLLYDDKKPIKELDKKDV